MDYTDGYTKLMANMLDIAMKRWGESAPPQPSTLLVPPQAAKHKALPSRALATHRMQIGVRLP